MQKNLEQRYAIKFCVRLKKTKQEAYGILKEAYGDEQMSQASFYRWFNRFSEGNEQVDARKEEKIQEVQRLVMQDRRMSVRMISEAVGISIGTANTIPTEDLKLHKVCAKFVQSLCQRSSSRTKDSFAWNVAMTMPHATSQRW